MAVTVCASGSLVTTVIFSPGPTSGWAGLNAKFSVVMRSAPAESGEEGGADEEVGVGRGRGRFAGGSRVRARPGA